MPDDRPNEPPSSSASDRQPPFGEAGPAFEEAEAAGSDAPFDASGALPGGLDASLALQIARSWVKRHQKATMLGALAAGVVIGSLLRE